MSSHLMSLLGELLGELVDPCDLGSYDHHVTFRTLSSIGSTLAVHWQSIGGSTGNLAYCIAWGTAARRRGRGKPDLNEFQVRDCEFDV